MIRNLEYEYIAWLTIKKNPSDTSQITIDVQIREQIPDDTAEEVSKEMWFVNPERLAELESDTRWIRNPDGCTFESADGSDNVIGMEADDVFGWLQEYFIMLDADAVFGWLLPLLPKIGVMAG